MSQGVVSQVFYLALPERGDKSPRDFDVLLRHRLRSISRRSTAFHAKQDCCFSSKAAVCLLPQPGGFEGLLRIAVVPPIEEQPLAFRRDRGCRDVGLDFAASGAEVERSDHQQTAVSEVADVGVVQAKRLEGLAVLREEPADACMASIGSLDRGSDGREAQSGCMVASQASRSPRLNASRPLRNNSTFSSDIAYSEQPGGFEGLLTILKPLCASDQPVVESEDNPVVVFHLDAA